MKNLFYPCFLLFVSSVSFASMEGIECPQVKLVCSQSVLSTKTHIYELKATHESTLKGINNDEPSLPANECEAMISIKSAIQTKKSLHVSVHGEDKNNLIAFLYVAEDFGATNPQFSIEVKLNQIFNLHSNPEQLMCKVVPVSYLESK